MPQRKTKQTNKEKRRMKVTKIGNKNDDDVDDDVIRRMIAGKMKNKACQKLVGSSLSQR